MMQDGSVGGMLRRHSGSLTPASRTTGESAILNSRSLIEMVLFAHKAGWQVGIHAIGDKAVEHVP
jgi:predicted amidohydrolase YtcJ